MTEPPLQGIWASNDQSEHTIARLRQMGICIVESEETERLGYDAGEFN